ncbi:MAG: flagellin [Roseibium sp.]
MSDIALSAGVRNNLNTLQSTADMMSKVQNTLATGKKVNSALDNANSFFTASGLNARAGDLGTLQDDMGQSLQTIKAADKGIETITKLVESAKAKANQAQQTQSQSERAQFAKQYNELLTQIEDAAKDSSYKGKNLLAGDGNDLTAIFNEDATSKLTVSAVDFTDTTLEDGLNLSDLAEAKGGAASFQLEGGKTTFSLTRGASGDALASGSLLADDDDFTATDVISLQTDAVTGTASLIADSGLTVGVNTTVNDLVDKFNSIAGVRAEYDESKGELTVTSNDTVYVNNNDVGSSGSATPSPTDIGSAVATNFNTSSALLTGSGSFATGDTLELTDGNGYELGSFEIEADSTVKDLQEFLDDQKGVDAEFNSTTGKITYESDVTLSLTSDNKDFNASGFTADSDGITATAAVESGFATDKEISRVTDRLNSALSNLRAQASEFGTNLSTVEIRQDFTREMINTLEEGAGKLTLADTNKEGANLLALQTRQSLASTSLSFASQADQSVLRLF